MFIKWPVWYRGALFSCLRGLPVELKVAGKGKKKKGVGGLYTSSLPSSSASSWDWLVEMVDLGTKVKTRTGEMGEESGGQIQGFPERLHTGSGLGIRIGAGAKVGVG